MHRELVHQVGVRQQTSQIDFPGFLRTGGGGYMVLEDFPSFVADAAAGNGDTKERAMGWRRSKGSLRLLNPCLREALLFYRVRA
jgi:hypothetical protein